MGIGTGRVLFLGLDGSYKSICLNNSSSYTFILCGFLCLFCFFNKKFCLLVLGFVF